MDPRRTSTAPRRLGRLLVPVGPGLAFYVVAALSLALTRGADSMAAFWPCNGVLLLAPPQARRYLAAAGLSSLIVNWQAGSSAGLSAAFTLANLGEAALTAWLLRRGGVEVPSFVDPVHVGRFCSAAGAASATGALLATTASSDLSLGLATSWIATGLLGILIVTPILLVLADKAGCGARVEASSPPSWPRPGAPASFWRRLQGSPP